MFFYGKIAVITHVGSRFWRLFFQTRTPVTYQLNRLIIHHNSQVPVMWEVQEKQVFLSLAGSISQTAHHHTEI